MKTNSILLFLFLSICPLILNAQPPGYLGKRATISLGISSFPTIDGPTQNNNGSNFFGDSNERSWGVDYEFEGNFSYTVGRQSSIGLTVGQLHTGMTTRAETEALVGSPIPSFEPIDYHELFYRLNVRSISLTHSIYRSKKGALSPLGNYFFWGIKRSFISGKVIDKKTDYHAGEVFGHRSLEIDPKTAYSSIIFGWSNHQIYWDKLIVKTGFRFGVPLNIFSWNKLSDNNDTNQEEFEIDAYQRLWRHEIIRIDFGIGYLLF
jgi:hypothetical protein